MRDTGQAKKPEFFLNKTKRLRDEIDENGIKPSTEKVRAIINLKHRENQKQLKSFPGANEKTLCNFYGEPKDCNHYQSNVLNGFGEHNKTNFLIS